MSVLKLGLHLAAFACVLLCQCFHGSRFDTLSGVDFFASVSAVVLIPFQALSSLPVFPRRIFDTLSSIDFFTRELSPMADIQTPLQASISFASELSSTVGVETPLRASTGILLHDRSGCSFSACTVVLPCCFLGRGRHDSVTSNWYSDSFSRRQFRHVGMSVSCTTWAHFATCTAVEPFRSVDLNPRLIPSSCEVESRPLWQAVGRGLNPVSQLHLERA